VLASPAGYPTLTTRIYSDLTLASTDAAFVEALMLAVVLVCSRPSS
jgi:ABC-type Fe3+ transport system permease subunit